MNDFDKTKEQLVAELHALREKLTRAEATTTKDSTYRDMLEKTSDMMFLLDDAGTFLEFIRGTDIEPIAPAETFLGRSVSEILPPPVARLAQQCVSQTLATGQKQTAEFQLPNRGETSHFEARFFKIASNRVFAIIRDVSERHQMEQSLEQERNLLRTIIDLAHDYIFVKDTAGRHVISNRAHTHLLGKTSPDEVVGKTNAGLFSEALTKIYEAEDQQILQTGESILRQETFSSSEANTPLWLEKTKIPLHDAHGDIIGIVGFMRDVTERKLVEQTFLENEKLRIELEKEHELTRDQIEFMTTISHEFRTPLASILMAGEVLEKHWEQMPDDRKRKKVQQIVTYCTALEELLNDFSFGMQAERGYLEFTPANTNLVEICAHCIDLFEGDLLGNHSIRLTTIGQLDHLWLDGKLMNRVISNLLSNALKYSPDGGEIQLKLARHEQNVIISCRDEGIGISEEDQPRLFTPFYRARNVGAIRGTGLGLSIIKSIVKLHGGTITCFSELGIGTTFEIQIPIVQNQGA